ncbi:MAG: flagellar hook-associated protein FlgK [Deltaproteobacteria bacterium]|nr:MAG: flagellar hook-associated protein FlgK [Deltaproteobacteria bacterium]
MSGLTHTLNIAKIALAVQQYGISVTGHNISNVNNPDYSRQDIPMSTYTPVLQGGFLFGNGVEAQQVEQTVNQYLEDRLAGQRSQLSASEAFMMYMNVMEGYFNENSDSSISGLMPEFWNAWYNLSNSPTRPSERAMVYENGIKIAERFNALDDELLALQIDISQEINSTLQQVNRIAGEIAAVNQEIVSLETNRTANDQRDIRNGLVAELAELIDIQTFEEEDGALTVAGAKGTILVNGIDTFDLTLTEGRILWEGSFGARIDITDEIQGGKIGGWLDMRDSVIPQYRADLSTYAREMIWEINYEYSQGIGASYFNTPLTGTYRADDSGFLSTMAFGSRLNTDGAFTLWVENNASSTPTYESVSVDMGVSDAHMIGWTGAEPAGNQVRYAFTVVESGMTGEGIAVTNGTGVGVAQTGDTITAATRNAIGVQTLTLTDADGTTRELLISDANGDAGQSARSIAEALRAMDGIDAYAADTALTLDLANLMPGVNHADENDVVSFTLQSGAQTETVSFTIGPDNATTLANVQTALNRVVDDNADLTVVYNGTQVTLVSGSGENIGIGDFDVADNATLTLDTFVQDSGGPGMTTFDIGGINVSFNLDTSGGQAQAAQHLINGLHNSDAELAAAGITYRLNAAGTGVVITRTGEADLSISGLDSNGGGDDGGFSVSSAAGTRVDGTAGGAAVLSEAGATSAAVTADRFDDDTLGFDGTVLTESGGGGADSGVKTGVVTVYTAPGITIRSNADPALGGLFNVPENTDISMGDSILTLGGDGGFAGFDPGDTISFDIDGVTVSYTVNPGDTDAAIATGFQAALTGALDPAAYTVVQTGAAVSVMSTNGQAIHLTNFADDDGSGAGNAAAMNALTGSGYGIENPDPTVLTSGGLNQISSAIYDAGGVIYWEKMTDTGNPTGDTGYIRVDDAGPYTVDGITFDLDGGALVAGNTMTLNTNDIGEPDPLDLTLSGISRSVLDTYTFEVQSPGGTIGPDEIVINWESQHSAGSITIEGKTPPILPQRIAVDGMTLEINGGTLFEKDVFVVTTDADGVPSLEAQSDWHWTLDSFKNQFNRQAPGIKAVVDVNNAIRFEADDDGYMISDVACTGVDGFCSANTAVRVLNYTAFDQPVEDLQFARDTAGNWTLNNDYTGGLAQLLPPGGSDEGFGVDLTGNGVADLQIDFHQPVTGSGHVSFDIEARNPSDYAFAFSGGEDDSGMAAILGVNTFFTGEDAMSMGVNAVLEQNKYIASARINEETGRVEQGDNTNALALTDLQFATFDIQQWQFERGGDAASRTISSGLDAYYTTLVGRVGVQAQSEQRSMEFNAVMVYQMTTERDQLSAVSLDEEMINLTKYQQAYTAASKLLTIVDEMLNTLVSMR